MCDHCSPRPTRRQILQAAALTVGTAALAACDTTPVNELPDVYLQPVSDEFGGQVKIDPAKIVVPPVQIPQKSNDYGSIMPRTAWTNSPLQLKNATPIGAVTRA